MYEHKQGYVIRLVPVLRSIACPEYMPLDIALLHNLFEHTDVGLLYGIGTDMKQRPSPRQSRNPSCTLKASASIAARRAHHTDPTHCLAPLQLVTSYPISP